MSRHRVNSFFFLLISLFALSFFNPALVSAEAIPSRTIRIGISEYPSYAYKNADGRYDGIDVEYAYTIAQYANLSIQLTLIPDAETYFKSLDDGRVDILFDAIKTKQREKKYLYSEYETGSTPLAVYVRNDDDRFDYGNISQLSSLVFGSEKDSYVTSIFISYCKEHGFTPKVIEYADSSKVNQALDAKKIDAGVYGTDVVEGYRTIITFEPTPYYIICRKGDAALKNRIDEAMSELLSENPLYKTELVEKYTPENHVMDALTKSEKEYIKNKQNIRIAVIKNDAPYFNIEGKSYTGVFPDYYKEIENLTTLHFVFFAYNNQKEAIDAIKNGTADLLALYSDSHSAAYESGLRLTSPYTTVNAMLMTHAGAGYNSIKRIAVKERSLALVKLRGGFSSDIEFVPCVNARECFKALKSGKADALIAGLPSVTWLSNQTNSSLYKSTTLASMDFELHAAIAYNNELLCSILNKAIHATKYNFNSIISRNSIEESNFVSFISRIPPALMVVAFAVLFTIILMLFFILFTLARRQREKAAVEAQRAQNRERQAQLDTQARSTEMRNQFFSNISHDMRTPLNAIIGFSNLGMKTAIDPNTKDCLNKIQASGKLLLELIDDTLTISKINSGKLRLNKMPIESGNLYEPLIVPVRASAELKNISFTVHDTSAKRIVVADMLNVQKILLNLLSNAVKYSRENGKVEFTIKDEQVKNKSNIVFTISDNGIGISESFLPHIYEPFIQEQRYADISAGTGLGLSIVKNLVDMMDGTIDVQSIVNEGTTFTVHLPFENTTQQPEKNSANESIINLSGLNVLLCEDNVLNSEIAVTLLKEKGMKVTAAMNGQEGIDTFIESKENEFDLILMDLRMPVMNGYEAVHAIRSMNRHDAKKIPIIAMTADAFEDDAKKCFECGMNAHITKPIDPDKLFRAISMLIADTAK